MACVQQDLHADDPDRGTQVDSTRVLLAAWRSDAEESGRIVCDLLFNEGFLPVTLSLRHVSGLFPGTQVSD